MFREEEFFTYKVRLFQMTVYIMRLNNERFFLSYSGNCFNTITVKLIVIFGESKLIVCCFNVVYIWESEWKRKY